MLQTPLIKKIICLITLAVMTCGPIYAKNFYTVYDIKGTVYSVNKATTTKLKKKDLVSDETVLRFSKGDQIWLLSSNKQNVYKIVDPTKKSGTTVAQLVAEARDHVIASISDISAGVFSGISSDKTPGDRFTRSGVANVVTNANGTITMLRSMLGPDEIIKKSNIRPVKVRKIKDWGELFHFSFKNESGNIFYSNLILKDSDPDSLQFLFPANVALKANGTTDLKEVQFLVPKSPFAGYILILSDSDFTIGDIKKELEVATQDTKHFYIYELIE